MSSPSELEAEHPSSSSRPQVVYVMGAGHSGSTILGVALNNCSGFFYAGEMDNWLIRRGISSLGGTERTRFWKAVRDETGDAKDLFGTSASKSLERSSALSRRSGRSERKRLRPRYQQVMGELYRAVARVSGADYIVDTSHFPLRARELQRVPDLDVYLILLVRDAQSVADSFVRHVNRNSALERKLALLVTNLDLWLTFLLSIGVFLTHPRDKRVLLSHESFLEDPEGVLRRLLGFVGSSAPLPDLSALETGIPIRANRFIREEVVSLQRKRRPQSHAPTFTRLLQAPWYACFARLTPRISPAGDDT